MADQRSGCRHVTRVHPSLRRRGVVPRVCRRGYFWIERRTLRAVLRLVVEVRRDVDLDGDVVIAARRIAARCTPLPRRRSFCPLDVPAGPSPARVLPSRVGTSTLPPRIAPSTGTGTSTSRSDAAGVRRTRGAARRDLDQQVARDARVAGLALAADGWSAVDAGRDLTSGACRRRRRPLGAERRRRELDLELAPRRRPRCGARAARCAPSRDSRRRRRDHLPRTAAEEVAGRRRRPPLRLVVSTLNSPRDAGAAAAIRAGTPPPNGFLRICVVLRRASSSSPRTS